MKTIRDTWLIFRRSLVLTLRQPTWVVFGMMLPVLYLVLFGPLLEGAVEQAGAGTNASRRQAESIWMVIRRGCASLAANHRRVP